MHKRGAPEEGEHLGLKQSKTRIYVEMNNNDNYKREERETTEGEKGSERGNNGLVPR